MKRWTSISAGLKAGAVTAMVFMTAGPVVAGSQPGRIVVAGDEWELSDAGFPLDRTFGTRVAEWFGLASGAQGKRVLVLDGQSANSGFNGTAGAFGSVFRGYLSGLGATVTYRGVTGDPVTVAGHDAVFVDGRIEGVPSLVSDLSALVAGGGAVYVAGGTGMHGGGPSGESAFWQPFFTAVTGTSDFGLGTTGWFAREGALVGAGPVGNGVTELHWYMGQDVRVGNTPHASVVLRDSVHALVAAWSAPSPLAIRPEGGGVRLTWAGDGILQSAPRPEGPYEDVVGATSPFDQPVEGVAARFFRLR